MIRAVALSAASAGLVLAVGLAWSGRPQAQTAPAGLKSAAEFAAIADDKARAVALFEEAGKVLLHPRCVNCHPAGDSPLQGMDMHIHQPPVTRGVGDFGATGMTCTTCHAERNVDLVAQADGLESIPGHPAWHLAPIEQAWEGRSLGDICEQIKDPARNGGKDMSELIHHMAEDSLVGWGWDPGEGREPAPGTQKVFGELFQAWADAGAECPAG